MALGPPVVSVARAPGDPVGYFGEAHTAASTQTGTLARAHFKSGAATEIAVSSDWVFPPPVLKLEEAIVFSNFLWHKNS